MMNPPQAIRLGTRALDGTLPFPPLNSIMENDRLSISMFTPDKVHYGSMTVERIWKNYGKKRPIVNPVQDEQRNVNLSSDINPKP
jgi:hypothetical protein